MGFSTPISAASVIRIGLDGQPQTLDPAKTGWAYENRLVIDLFEGLIRQDSEGNPQPGAAKSWESAEDGRLWLFHLRADGKWSDGTAVTAEDFIFAWKRILAPNSPDARNDRFLTQIVGAEEMTAGHFDKPFGALAKDPTTLEIRFKTPFRDFDYLANDIRLLPVPRHKLLRLEERWSQPDLIVGNGAYRVAAWTPHKTLVLEKSQHYWDRAHVAIERVEFLPVGDSNLQFKKFRTGELDIASRLPVHQFAWSQANMAQNIVSSPSYGMTYLFFRLNGAAWERDTNVRHALELALDRGLIANSITHGLNDPAYQIVPVNMKNYGGAGPLPGPEGQAAREQEAKRLWALPGAPRPRKLKLSFANNEQAALVLKSIADMWRHVLDIDASLDESDLLENDDQTFAYPFDILYESWNSSNVGDFLEPFTSDAGTSNYVRYESKPYDALIARSRSEPDPEESARLLQEAERLILADCVVIPLLQIKRFFLVSTKVRGFAPNPMGRFYSRDLSLG